MAKPGKKKMNMGGYGVVRPDTAQGYEANGSRSRHNANSSSSRGYSDERNMSNPTGYYNQGNGDYNYIGSSDGYSNYRNSNDERGYNNNGYYSNVADERRRVPACVYEDMNQTANLPTEVMMMDYPNFPSVPQRLDDSINYSDRQIVHGIKGVSRQILDKSY